MIQILHCENYVQYQSQICFTAIPFNRPEICRPAELAGHVYIRCVLRRKVSKRTQVLIILVCFSCDLLHAFRVCGSEWRAIALYI